MEAPPTTRRLHRRTGHRAAMLILSLLLFAVSCASDGSSSSEASSSGDTAQTLRFEVEESTGDGDAAVIAGRNDRGGTRCWRIRSATDGEQWLGGLARKVRAKRA